MFALRGLGQARRFSETVLAEERGADGGKSLQSACRLGWAHPFVRTAFFR